MNPLVQCITNFVSMDIMANSLLSAGASPAMVCLFICLALQFICLCSRLASLRHSGRALCK